MTQSIPPASATVSTDSGFDDEIDLFELVRTLWESKLTILCFTVVFAAAGTAYALFATPWYKADVVLAPTEKDLRSGLTAELGGLAAIAGIGGAGDDKSIEAIATLTSRELASDFIEDHGLIQRIFESSWDAEAGRWKAEDPDRWPDVRDAILFYQKKMVTVTQDRKTQLITLTLRWTDPDEASKWATELVARVNEQMRARAEREAETNLAYLNKELATTTVVNLQQAISRLIETEMQKLMLARNSDDYAVRTIDAAQVPKRPESPKKALIVVLATLAGGFLSLVWLGALHLFRRFRDTARAT
jgi:uncharacterized protein involved in exopolysaccharide biosynthesis